jgi:hypothetical protein
MDEWYSFAKRVRRAHRARARYLRMPKCCCGACQFVRDVRQGGRRLLPAVQREVRQGMLFD